VGSLHLDVIVTAPHLPREDETVTGSAVTYAFGGKGGNQAVAAARMGARVAMAGAVGDDAFAARLLAGLAGVDATGVRVVPGPSGMSVAIMQPDGSYGAVIVSGANLAIDAGAVEVPPDARVLVLQNEVPEAVNLSVARRARAAGVTVVMNAAPARAMDAGMLQLVDVLVVNRVEAEALAGSRDPAAAAQALAALGPGRVIVTLGAGGLVLCDGAVTAHPAREVAVVSSHGAGDAFIGALAARLDAGEGLADAAAFAQGAAALHVSSAVAARGEITAERVAAFLRG
jgi:ribokinase